MVYTQHNRYFVHCEFTKTHQSFNHDNWFFYQTKQTKMIHKELLQAANLVCS